MSIIFRNMTTVSYDLTCNQNCECDRNKFSPICGSDGLTYYSSCYAGCRSSHIENGKTQFFDCDCIEKCELFVHSYTIKTNCDVQIFYYLIVIFCAELFAAESVLDKVEAVSGFCDGNCQNFFYFIILFSFLVFIHSTSEVGSMLLIMRCTDPKGLLIRLVHVLCI